MSETICRTKEACGCQNLNDNEVRKRKVLGYSSLVIAFAVVGLNKVQQPDAWVHATTSIPFFFAYLNLFQARQRTCVALAFQEIDYSGPAMQPIEDRETGRRLKRRSAKMIAGAAALAALSAAVCWKI